MVGFVHRPVTVTSSCGLLNMLQHHAVMPDRDRSGTSINSYAPQTQEYLVLTLLCEKFVVFSRLKQGISVAAALLCHSWFELRVVPPPLLFGSGCAPGRTESTAELLPAFVYVHKDTPPWVNCLEICTTRCISA